MPGRAHLHEGSEAPARASNRRALPAAVTAAILVGLLLGACGPRVVRMPVTPDQVLQANRLAADADLAFARKDHYAALIKYLEAGRLNPNSEYIFNKIGIAYSQLKLYPDATRAFQRAIGLNGKYPYAHNNLGTVYFATNDKKKAEKAFKKAIGINEKIASFHVNLGTLYFEQKKFDKGMAEWRKGLALDPGIMGKSDGINLAAAGRGPTPEKSYMMARIYASFGDVERALDNLQAALNAGFTEIDMIRKEPDFDKIREDTRFVAFMRTAAILTRP